MPPQEPSQPSTAPESTTLILALSGPSSSGKTTLARLLRTIITSLSKPDAHPQSLPPSISTFILHEDDFYVTDALIPIDPATGLQDWDCVGAIDTHALVKALEFIKRNGRSPDELVSKEDQNEVGDSSVSDEVVENLTEKLRSCVAAASELRSDAGKGALTVAIIDGFLLYAPPDSSSPMKNVLPILDVKLFLRTTWEKMKDRREKRKGYVTLEGFWEDPPGYVDKIVWPNYVRDHEWMFAEGNVDTGDVKTQVEGLGIRVAPGKGETGMEGLLRWAIDIVGGEIEEVFRKVGKE